MKNIINWILASSCGLILIGCNSGGSGSAAPINSAVQILGPIHDSTGMSFDSTVVPPTTFSFITAKPTPPTTSLTSPNPTTNVSTTPTITLTFSEAVFGITTNSIQVQNLSGTPESATIIKSDNSYTFKLNQPLLHTTEYMVVVKSGIRSLSTLVPVLSTQFNFTTASPTPPTVSLTSPNPRINVSVTPTIILTFSEAVSNVNTNTIQFQGPGIQTQPTITQSGNSYTLTTDQLFYGARYSVIVNSGIISVATGLSVAPTQFNFITAPQPTVSLTSPDPTTDVSLTPTIILTFSEVVSNVNANTIRLVSQRGDLQNITFNQSGNSYTLTLSQPLLGSTFYILLVNGGITSVETGAEVAPTQFQFSTL